MLHFIEVSETIIKRWVYGFLSVIQQRKGVGNMKTLASKDIFELVGGEHRNPHKILGLHKMEKSGETMIVVRSFLPEGLSVVVIDAKNKKKRYPMKKIHDHGLFEVVIEDRQEWFSYLLEYTNIEGITWQSYDPYGFIPTISEYDRYLFAKGTHYDIYNKMGARLVRQNLDITKEDTPQSGVKGVAFTVWAPSAKCVSVIGEFNQWHTKRHPMRLLGASGVWELFIPGLVEGDLYKFHIVQADGKEVDKADPYGRYSQLRPASASVVFGKDKYKWKDKKWLTSRKKKDYNKEPMNIYEVHLGSWKRDEENQFLTYEKFADELVDYVKNMGYTHIELMPITEHPFDGSWGYQATGYYAPTSRFGTPHGFRYFIDKCHQEGIGVILDWVPAHFPKDEFALGKFDGTALYEHADPRVGEHPQWGTYIFNYGRNEVSNFLIANALYWFKEFHIDGLRVDAVASMLYLDFCKEEGQWLPNVYGNRENIEAIEFIKHLNSIIKKEDLGVVMIAEESTSWQGVTRSTEEDGLGFDFKWDMGWMNDFLDYVKLDPISRKHHHNALTFAMAYHHSENFVLPLSHDEVVHEKSSMIGKMPGDNWKRLANLRLAYGFMYAHPGKKLCFMGGEFGQYGEWDEGKSLDWHLLAFKDHEETLSYSQALNHLYLEESAFWQKDNEAHGFQWITCDDKDNSLVAFIRRSENSEVYVVCNFTPKVHDGFCLGVPVMGEYEEIFNSDAIIFGGSGVVNEENMKSIEKEMDGFSYQISIKVPPLGLSVFRKK